ncbi:MAG: hypothetical protein U9O87_07905 [Verrucomicrobiota bacterium]|nr:hypothetical protein [Verrucomicrobiota bacterium]
MNKNISVIAIKLFGVYLGFSFIRSIHSAILMLFMKKSDFIPSQTPYFIITIAYLLIYLTIAILFIFKTKLILKLLNLPYEKTKNIVENFKPFAFSLGLILIGLYFLFSALPYLISYGITFISGTALTTTYSGFIWWTRCGEKIITVILSFILIIKSNAIGTYLIEIINKNSQP